jgi:hypothetical protein
MKLNPIQEHFDKINFFFATNSGTSGNNELKSDFFQFTLYYNKMCKHLGIDNKSVISNEEVLRIMDMKIE